MRKLAAYLAVAGLFVLSGATMAGAVPSNPPKHVSPDTAGAPDAVSASPAAASVEAVSNVLPRPFAAGDLFAATKTGSLNWYAQDGTFVAELATGLSSIQAVAADPAGRLWAISAANPATLARIDETGAVTTQSPVGATATPFSLTFDALGNVYVGDWDVIGRLSKFSSAGQFLGVAIHNENDYIDLAPDQCTMYVQRPGWNMSATERWNACTGAFIDVFHDPHSDDETARGLRLLPDGSVLMANPGVFRVDPAGQVASTYSFPECTLARPETLNPSGSTFFAYCSGQGVYEVDIATGARLRTLNIAAPLTMMGGFRAAATGAPPPPPPPPPPPDVTPPTIDIDVPVDGGRYEVTRLVTADYACADTGGSGLASCTGPVPSGGALDTSTVGQKTFVVTASDGAGNTASVTAHYEVVLPALAITDVSSAEGTAATFTVSLSSATAKQVTVKFATSNGTARQGTDFVRTTGTLTFAPGQLSKTISVPTIDDALYEPDETFVVSLTSPTNATLGDAQGTATIANDDPIPSLTIADVSRLEGPAGTNSQLVVTVTQSAPSAVASRVVVATANGTAVSGSDYGAKSATVTIRAGSTSATVAITIKGDAVVEPNETFRLLLSAPTDAVIADGEAVATILNDD